MNIAVCIKQVPGTTKVDIDEKTGVLKRDTADAKMNPYDLYALETALLLRERHGGRVSVITMGPPQAEGVIKEAYAMGADEGFLLTDRAFAGADVLATSRALAGCLRHAGGFDLIVCGKQTTDGDTAQVGPEIAERLNIPHVACVTGIQHIGDGEARLTADLGEVTGEYAVTLPCLITVEKDIHVPRLPSYKKMLESKERPVTLVTLADLQDKNPAHYGLDGSPTRVERIFPPTIKTARRDIDGDADTAAESLFAALKQGKLI